MKKRWKKGIFRMLFFIVFGAWAYYFPYQKHLAHMETDQYLKAQGVKTRAIQSRDIQKRWMLGDYVTKIKDTNDLKHVYGYIYKKGYKTHGKLVSAMCLIIYEHGTNAEDNQVVSRAFPHRYKK